MAWPVEDLLCLQQAVESLRMEVSLTPGPWLDSALQEEMTTERDDSSSEALAVE